MKDNFIRVCAATNPVRVADTVYNRQAICEMMRAAAAEGAAVIVFPELCITGYTCNDLFYQNTLLQGAKEALFALVRETAELDALIAVGLPWEYEGKLYNVAALLSHGDILGMVPKSFIPNYGEFYEARHFASGSGVSGTVAAGDASSGTVYEFPFGTDILFACTDIPALRIAAEVCEDVWTPCPPSISHALAGATVMLNLSASDEVTGKDVYRRELVVGQSARLLCAYVYASAGEGESSQDLVFSGHSLIAEGGAVLSETATRFASGYITADVCLDHIVHDRRQMNTFQSQPQQSYRTVPFRLGIRPLYGLRRPLAQQPFVPAGKADREKRCEDILSIQSTGLRKRLSHTGCQHAVIGLSGGLDSTLALLVTVRAFDSLALPRSGIVCVTMPCFGTTDRTYRNACRLAEALGATLREINICSSVLQHFRDIGHNPDEHDVTYENGQARERTQVLMDIANQVNGMVIGTGDMSELALGWATYNGDHMSMYGVNASVPKTLVRHLVRYYADTCSEEGLRTTLLDVLDTPVSPELLPPKDGQIAQKTEDIVGPYELHDFFLYYILRMGYTPAKIYRLAVSAFAGTFDSETVLKWLRVFYRRFFAQQFKRSCLPDGPKVGTVSVSPRGDLRMPSDACAALWLAQLDGIEAARPEERELT